MDCSTLQRHQETMSSQSLDSMIMCTKPENDQLQQEKKPRPLDDQALKCPRCDSSNTKFCYYNNYSLSQPRYFCKSCRRYWTKGGTLRNVPVGGGCRKNRRSSSSSSSSKKSISDHHLQVPLTYDHHTGLTLAHGNISLLGNNGNPQFDLFDNPSGNSFLDTLRSGFIESSHSLYYGNLGHQIENGGLNLSHENQHDFALQFDNNTNHNYNQNYNHNSEIMSNPSSGSSTPTGVKQEVGENRILWGFPWQQLNGEGWNSAIVGSSWNNNLLNSPLM